MRWVLLLIIVVAVYLVIRKYMSEIDQKLTAQIFSDYGPAISSAGAAFRIPEERIVAIIAKESSGDRNVKDGAAGEIGLMQVTPGALSDFNRINGASYNSDSLRNPSTNIMVGTGYLASLVSDFDGDLDLATQAYNAGPGNVSRGITALSYLGRVKDYEQAFLSTLT